MRVFIKSNEKILVTSLIALHNAGLFPLIIHAFGVKGRLLNLLSSATFWVLLFFFYSLFLLMNIEITKFVRRNNIDNWSFMNKMSRILSCVSKVNVLWVDLMYHIEYVHEKKRLDSESEDCTTLLTDEIAMSERPILTMTRLVLHRWCLTVIHHVQTSDNRATQDRTRQTQSSEYCITLPVLHSNPPIPTLPSLWPIPWPR